MSRKFDKVFSEVCFFMEVGVETHMACSRRQYTKDEALTLFYGYDGDILIDAIQEDLVRFRGGYDWDGDWGNAWYAGEGTLPIWMVWL